MRLQLAGRNIAYDFVGPAGAPVVCMTHSLASDGGMWAEQVPPLLAAGFRVLRCTYANSLLMPVALAKFRLWEPLLGGAASTGLEPVAPWLDRWLYAPLVIESAWIGAGVNFAAGQSLLLIGEKMV